MALTTSMVDSALHPTCGKNFASCRLPDCFCDYRHIPEHLSRHNTPQMVLLTYQGYVDEDIFELIFDQIWSPGYKNPDGCGLGMTIFAAGKESNNCSLHKLYTLGYEVASSTYSMTPADTLSDKDWDKYLVEDRDNVTKGSYLDVDHIQGMRAPKERPGGDLQFQVLMDNGFSYDSSILYVPESEKDSPWPFTLDMSLDDMKYSCSRQACPANEYSGLWEVPIVRLIGNHNRQCTYLRDCMGGMKSTDDVSDLLLKMLDGRMTGNRAPMMINLDSKTLNNPRVMIGLQKFLTEILHGEFENIWVLSIQQLLEWMRTPVTWQALRDKDTVDVCTRKRKYHRCGPKSKRKDRIITNFRAFMDVEKLWIYQCLTLFVLYFVVLRYDKIEQGKKN